VGASAVCVDDPRDLLTDSSALRRLEPARLFAS